MVLKAFCLALGLWAVGCGCNMRDQEEVRGDSVEVLIHIYC